MLKSYFKLEHSQTSVLLLFYILFFFIYFSFPQKIYAQKETSIDKVIELEAVAGLKYSRVRLVVTPGSTVRIRLLNTDEMAHNLLITKPNMRIKVIKAAEALGEDGMKNNFIPESPNVLASIPLLNQGEKASTIFKVPDKEAVYPYVCTYPAHGRVMYGAMYVTNNPEELPPLDQDPHIPGAQRNQLTKTESPHPYPMEMPQITRLFMPGASPASIAVGMEENQSYCWDAGYCFLRYAWAGGYIDASKQWEGKSTEMAEIEGKIFFKNESGFPFKIAQNDSTLKPDFKGYKLINGYPEFIYKIGEITVYQLITPQEKTGLRIQYRMEHVTQPVWYVINSKNDVHIEASKGIWKNNKLKLLPAEAAAFTISISPKEE